MLCLRVAKFYATNILTYEYDEGNSGFRRVTPAVGGSSAGCLLARAWQHIFREPSSRYILY